MAKFQTIMESTRLAGEELLRALSHHDWEGIRRVCRSDYVHHAPGVPAAGLDAYIATLQLVVAAVPDMTLEVQQIVTSDAYATLRYTVHGTHLHDFHGIPPSGAAIEMPVMGLVRVLDGLLAEGWYVFDSGMLILQSPIGKAFSAKREGIKPMFPDPHSLAPNLVVIEGRHPTLLWEACDVPSIVVYRSPKTLYVLDTGVGPEQRAVLETQMAALGQGAEEIVLINSHGHFDHLGNNDLLLRSAIPRKRHLIAKDAVPDTDIRAELFAMYGRGKEYFSYIDGLPLPADKISGLLKTLGAPVIAPATLEELGGTIQASGVLPALNLFMPSIVVDVLMATYPDVFPSMETMTFLEDISAPNPIELGGAPWSGWTLGGETPEVYVLFSGGHSKGGVVFYIPEHRFLMLADETTAVPIWPDTDPRRVVGTAQKALTMLDNGALQWLCAGHFPMVPSNDPNAVRASLQRILSQAQQFAATIEKEVAAHPEGLTVDELYAALRTDVPATSYVTFLMANQFPVFSTFMKLTLLNHLLLYNFPSRKEPDGKIRFLPSLAK